MACPEVAELDAYRLDHDLTWAQLAAEMARADLPMSPRTLHYLVKRAPPEARPLDRTLHKIRVFLAKRHARRATR
jgi:hypothetical protein